MSFLDLTKKRYSCRKFSDKKVEPELIEKIIDAGITAPTAKNAQPYKIWVFESEESVKNIEKITKYTFGAKVFLLVGYKEEGAYIRHYDDYNYAPVDASIVSTQMMLAITDVGLASTWVGYFDAPKLKEIYPQMMDYELITIFPLGYEADDAEPSPRHFERNSKKDMVERL